MYDLYIEHGREKHQKAVCNYEKDSKARVAGDYCDSKVARGAFEAGDCCAVEY